MSRAVPQNRRMMATGAFIWRREDVKTDFLGSAPFTFDAVAIPAPSASLRSTSAAAYNLGSRAYFPPDSLQ